MNNSNLLGWYLLLFFFAIGLFFLGNYDVHPWGDDYSQYVKQAQNFANGIRFDHTEVVFNAQNTMYGPPNYPPFYSLLLSPFIKYFGLDIKLLLNLNNVFIILLALASFGLFVKYLKPVVAFVVAVLLMYCAPLLELKTQLLSDIPCAMLVLLYLAIRGNAALKFNSKMLFLISITVAVLLTRTQYVLLPLAEFFFGLFILLRPVLKTKKMPSAKAFLKPELVVALAGILIYVFLAKTIFTTQKSSFDYYTTLLLNSTNILFEIKVNWSYLLDQFQLVTTYDTQNVVLNFINKSIGLLLLISFPLGYYASARKRFSFYHFLFLGIFIFHLLIPVRQGFRFLLPMVPLYLLFSFYGLQYILNRFQLKRASLYLVILCVLLLVMGKGTFLKWYQPFQGDSPYGELDKSCFAWLDANISKQDLVIFNKPRALALYARQKAMVLAWQVSADENLKTARNKEAKYVLIRKGLDEGWYENFIWQTGCAQDSVVINDFYKIYTFK